MTQAPPPSRPAKARVGLAGAKPGNPTPPHLQMELKHRIMVALGKLADRDTQQIAVEELDKLVEAISPDCVSICLSCLYDSDMQQKSVVKKECVRLFGTLASLHADLVVPHLPKIIASIMRRLRDPDSSVRDACVDAIAILSARMLSPSSSSPTGQEKENGTQAASALTLSTFSKPLFDALSEQNKSVQTGAALCLARVIESAKSPPLGAMARLCPRICKFMSNPNFLARPALLAVIGSLSQVGALAQQQLALLMPCVLEALESSDWATRKAAAETLSCVGSNLGTSLSCFKSRSLRVLESCRFDKVKPVRDSVHDATQLWKTLPGTECESPGSARKSDGPELAVAMQRLELRSPIPISKETIPVAAESPRNENKPQISSPNQLLKSSEKPFEAVKKRAPALTDKKPNPEFFQKLAARNADEWQVEVVVPRNRPPSMAQEPDMDIKEGNVEMDDLPLGSTSKRGQHETPIQDSHMVSSEKGREPTGPQSCSLIIDESPSSRSRGLRIMSVRQKEVMMGSDKTMLKDGVHNQAWEAYGHVTSLSSNSGLEASQSMNERSKWHFIQKQLTQLEQQQSSLMQMVQDIMANSQENMFVLQARVRDLEKVVEDMACEVGFSAGKRLHVGVAGHESSGFRPSGRYFPGPEYVNPRFGKSVDNLCRFADRVSVSESMNKGMRSAADRSSEPALEDWDEFAFKGSRGGLAGAYVLDGQAAGLRRNNVEGPGDLPRTDRENSENDQIGMIRVWDRVPGPVRLGEGPSARSVWQAAKDEATLAAIRVAGEDAELSEVDALSTAASRLGPSVSGSERLPHKDAGGGRNGKGQYWSLWGSAMEFVHAGDMESAYTEVLCAEDELMLMRLMSRTGPVLDQFTVTTATEVLHAVGQLLQQRSYFDFCLAWIQQVADMVANSGAECLDLSLDAKRELLMSLQESASMDLPDGWLGNSIDELLQQLANAWSMEIVPVGTDL